MEGKKWYQKVSNWLFILMLVILVPILIVNMYIMLQANQDEDKVPNIFGYKPFIVLSGSMETEIHKGDLIITKMIEPATLNISDVIAFRDNENTVTTHRIIDIVEKNNVKYFVTKGDNNNTQDQNLVEYKDVEGIYVGRIPMVGTILNELAKPTNAIIIVLGISVIFILLFTRSNKKLRLEEEKEFLEYKRLKALEESSKIELPKKKEVKKTATTSSKTATKTTTKPSSSKKSATKVVATPAAKTSTKKVTTKPVAKKTTTKSSSKKKTTAKPVVKKTATKTSSTKKVATKKTTAKQNSRKHS